MTSLAEALAEPEAPKTKPCAVAAVIQELAEDDAEALRNVCVSERSNQFIAERLQRVGYPITWQAVRSHRNLECACRHGRT
jgi:hypothetical protein